jgi:hypothetical protein
MSDSNNGSDSGVPFEGSLSRTTADGSGEALLPQDVDTCADGHLGSTMYNGICYCVICCGGKWWYVNYVIGGTTYTLRCNGGSANVGCNGRTYLVSC